MNCFDGLLSFLPNSVDLSRHHGPEQSDHVAIIGAGPAGIHMAAQLKKLGFEHVTVLEKSERIGGKSRTIVDDEGVPHEMGTCYLHSDYTEIRDLLMEYGIPEEDLDIGGRNFRNMMPVFDDTKTGATPFLVWILAQTEENIPALLQNFTEKKIYDTNLWKGIIKYGKLHRSLVGTQYFSLPNKPTDLSLIDMTFHEFLKQNDLLVLVPLLRYIHEGQGYGIIEQVPALYGIWWCTPHFVEHAFHWGRTPPSMAMMKHGFQNLWETIAKAEDIEVEFGIDITSISRRKGGLGGTKPVKIKFSGPNTQDREFDFLIMAVDMSTQHTLISDLRADEKRVFKSLTCYTLAATLYEADAHPNTAEIPPEEFWWERLKMKNAFHGHRNSSKSLFMHPTKKNPSREKKVGYQYNSFAPEGHEKELSAVLLEDLATVGEKNVKVIESQPWRYMPHFDQQAISKGYPWQLRGMQGHDRTWYIGSSVCFESVLDVVRYNLGLLNEMAVHSYEA